jgi:hypothetical protein
VTLTGATGNTCSYSSMAIQPNGSVSVTCQGGSTTPPPPPPPPVAGPGVFDISGPSSMVVGTTANFTVTRSNGNTGDAGLGWAVTTGCSPSGGVVNFTNGGPTTATITITAPATPGSCTVYIGGPSIGALGTTAAALVTINTGGGSTPQQPQDPTCPAVPADVQDFDLKLSGADVQRMPSGRIASAVLPVTGHASGQVVIGETTTSPRAATVEISINRCHGVIDTGAGGCYLRTDNPSFATLTWIEQAKWGTGTDDVIRSYGLCKAFPDQKMYVNMRYSYSQCNYGTCGFVSQWNYGPY